MKARSIARGGMMTGVSVVLLELGALAEFFSGAAALLAALVPALFFLRGEGQTGRLVYGATALLAVLFLPDKFTALIYALVLGLYTVVRLTIDWGRKTRRRICKALLVVIWTGLSAVVIQLGLVVELKAVSLPVLGGLLAGWTAFLLYYDFCLTRILEGMRRWLRRFR